MASLAPTYLMLGTPPVVRTTDSPGYHLAFVEVVRGGELPLWVAVEIHFLSPHTDLLGTSLGGQEEEEA